MHIGSGIRHSDHGSSSDLAIAPPAHVRRMAVPPSQETRNSDLARATPQCHRHVGMSIATLVTTPMTGRAMSHKRRFAEPAHAHFQHQALDIIARI